MSMESVKAGEIVELCRAKGFLAKPLFVVTTHPAAPMDTILRHVEEHLAYQVELERQGIMFAAGPLFSEDGEQWTGEGLVIIRAADLEEAHGIAARDPMHSSGARSFVVRPWLLNEGTVTVRVSFSDGRREIV